MKRSKHILGILILMCSYSLYAKEASLVMTGGKILTVDESFSIADSVAIMDGKIVGIGNVEDVRAYIGDDTKVIELDGRTAIPGLIDNHFHFIRSAYNAQHEVRLDGISSRQEALHALKDKASSAPKGGWITVIGGWSPEQFSDGNEPFTLAELDSVSKSNPVFLLLSYSSGLANSAAFNDVGQDPNESGEVAGIKEMSPFTNAISWRNKTASKQAILDYMQTLNQVGLTAVYDLGRVSDGNLEPVEVLASEQSLPLRVFSSLRYDAKDVESAQAAIELIESGDTRPLSNSLQSGVVGMGEHIYTPVSDNPRLSKSWSEDKWTPFSDISWAAAKYNWPVHEHVMSRTTAIQYLDLIEDISKEIPTVKKLRWTFAHVNGMTGEEIARAAELGVALAVHSQARMSTTVMNKPLIGTIAASGTLWGLGSDGAIVAPYNPFNTLEWAVAGTSISGSKGWSEDQTVSREVALQAHTINNAKLLFMEEHLGSLEVGKQADIIVLDQDYLTVESEQISEISPLMTITAGQIVFEKRY